MTWDRETFQRFAPRPKQERVGKLWDAYVECFLEHGEALAQEFGVDEPAEWWGLMGNIGHECNGLTIWAENLSYTTADRLLEIFGAGNHSANIMPSEVHQYLGNPQALAERVYGLGNPKKAAELGNTQAGDAYGTRGTGPLQTTGGTDHMRMFGRKDGNISMYDALRAAFQEWEEKGGNDLCRVGDFSKACRKVNGGTNGMKDRHAWHAKAKKVWPVLPFGHGAPATLVETKPLMKSETFQLSAPAALSAAGVTTIQIDTAFTQARAMPTWGEFWYTLPKALLFTETGLNWTLLLGIGGLVYSIATCVHRGRKPDIAGLFKPKEAP